MTEQQHQTKLGAAIRRARRSKDLTQTEVGHLVGCGPSFLCEVEQGKKATSVWMLMRLERALGPLWISGHRDRYGK